MTESEAIKILKKDSCYECAQGTDSPLNCEYGECRVAKATRVAIKALEDVQQYRTIGTLEECRAAVEKQTTMYWDAKHDECICPRCATHNPTWNMRAKTVEHDKAYCWHCGQSVEF